MLSVHSATTKTIEHNDGRKRTERRRSVRFPCGLGTSRHIAVKVKSDEPAGALVALVRNISASGISLLVNRPLEPGRVVSVELSRPSKFWSTDLALRIVYVLPHPEGEFIIGAAFDRELSAEQLRGLLGESRG